MSNVNQYIAVTRYVYIRDLHLSLDAMARFIKRGQVPEEHSILQEILRLDANAFVRDLRLDQHLQGFQHAELIEAIKREDLDIKDLKEKQYSLLYDAKIEICEEGNIVLQQLKRRHEDTDPAKLEEFYFGMKKKTLTESYMSIMLRIIKYMYFITEWQEGDPPWAISCIFIILQVEAIRAIMEHDWISEDNILIKRGENLLYKLMDILLEMRLESSRYQLVLLSGLAVLGLDCYNRGWKDARSYSNYALAVIKIMLIMVYGKAVRQVNIEGILMAYRDISQSSPYFSWFKVSHFSSQFTLQKVPLILIELRKSLFQLKQLTPFSILCQEIVVIFILAEIRYFDE